MNTRQVAHRQLMQSICEVIAEEDKPLLLKGGTALLLCYGLDRFSEDLDFDLEIPLRTHLNVKGICEEAVRRVNRFGLGAKLQGFAEPKKTETTHRCRPTFSVNGQSAALAIKIEISSRRTPSSSEIKNINGIKVYAPDIIASQKLQAAVENAENTYRTAARDLHDLVFLCSEYEGQLSQKVIEEIEHFLADPEALMVRYADAYEADPLLEGQLFQDLEKAENWLKTHKD